MNDEPVRSDGWLPPHAPGARPAPSYEDGPVPAPPVAPAEPAPPVWRGPEPGGDVRPPAPVRGPRRDPRPSSPAAGWGVLLGVAGIALLVISLGSLFVVSIPCSLAAWRLGDRARARALEAGSESGAAQARTAVRLGIAGAALGALALVAFVVLVAAGVDFEQLRQDLQDRSRS
jgi:hypothetical protein